MKSLKTFTNQKGFSVMEVIVVIGLISIIGGVGVSMSLDSYKTYSFEAEKRAIVSLLMKARNESMDNLNQNTHGLRFEANNFIVFEGPAGSAGEAIPRSSSVTSSGLSEVVFERLTGNALMTGDIVIQGAGRTATLSINSEGRINGY